MEGSTTQVEEPQAPEPQGELRGARDRPGEGDASAAELIRATAEGRTLSPDEVDAATEWFLTDEEAPETDNFELNVGSPDNPRWIGWTIRAVDQEVLKRIRREGEQRTGRRSRAAGAIPDIDPQEANARIVVEGTVTPDLAEIARRKGIEQIADPMVAQIQVVKHRFRHKPGLVDQIAGRIMDLSGYNEDDVREAVAAKN